MSESNGVAVMEAPAQATEPEAAPVREAAEAAAGAANSKAAAERREDEARAALAGVLKDCVRAYRKGEKAYAEGLLAAGEHAHRYVTGRMALGDSRKPALDVVTGQLSVYSSTTVRVDELIACWAAYDALAVARGVADKAGVLSYGHYREGFRSLMRRVNGGTATEGWELLPTVAEEAVQFFDHAIAAGLSREAVAEKCSALQRSHAAAEEAAKAAADKAAREAAEAARREREAAEAARKAEEGKAADAEAALKGAQDEATRQALQASMDEQREALRAKQKAEADAVAIQAEKDRVAARAAKDAEEARKRADNLARREQEKTTRREAKRGTDAKQGTSLLAVGKAGTAKDVAAMVVELVTGSDEPDSVLALVMQALDGHSHLGRPAHRAVKAFRVALASASARPEAPAVAKPEPNPAAPPSGGAAA